MQFLSMLMPKLTVAIVIAIVVTVLIRTRGRNYGREFEEFINEEKESNAVKSRALDEGMFFTPDVSRLPVKTDGDAEKPSMKHQSDVLKRAGRKMIRFDAPMTNTELKLKYGTVRLESISEYEENFFSYVYAINNWAESLLVENNEKDAETVLLQGVLSGAETSKTYTMLADLYFKHDKRAEMRELYGIISSKRMPAQEKTWRYINEYYTKMGL